MQVDEVSAFAGGDDGAEEEEDDGVQVRVDDLQKLRSEMLEEREQMIAKY